LDAAKYDARPMLAIFNASRLYLQLNKSLTCPTSSGENNEHENSRKEKWLSSTDVAELRPNDNQTYAKNEFWFINKVSYQ
jgi:hypothetical protein